MIVTAMREAVGRRELLANLTMRELRTRYRRSVLGWGWSLLNPLVITACYWLVFTVFLDVVPDPGRHTGNDVFAFFLLPGIVSWNLLANGLQSGMSALLGSHALIAKVNFPRELIVVGTVLALAMSTVIEFGFLVVALLAFGYNIVAYVPFVAVVLVLQVLFVTGFALALSAMSVRQRDIPYLTTVALTVWFYITPILYSPTLVPEQYEAAGRTWPLRDMIMANPMARFVEAYREALYHGAVPGWRTMLLLLVMSVTMFLAGYSFFVRRASRFAEEL
jgi:ABC-2 type transport system permease protein